MFCQVPERELTFSSDFPRGLSPKEGWKSLLNRILNIAQGRFGELTGLCQALYKLLLLKRPNGGGGLADLGISAQRRYCFSNPI